jgi:hypothetical protein
MTEKKGRQLLVLDLGPLKQDVARCASEDGKLPSQWARDALQAAVEAAGTTPRPRPAPASRRRQGGPTVRFDLRLLVSEADQLQALAGAEKLSKSEYMARLLMSPANTVIGPKTLAALAESNFQLQRLGANFNQLMKHLNEKPGQLTGADRQLIRDVAGAAQDHIKKASRFIAAYSATRRTGSGGWRKPTKDTTNG